MPDALDLLATRRTISAAFLAEPAPDQATLDQLLTIASRVPDHGKLTPWRFIVYRGAAREAVGARLAAIVQARDPAVTEARLADERGRFSRAPLVIGVVSRAAEHVKIPIWEQQMSAAAAAQNLLVAVHAAGFSGQWLTEWCAYDPEAAAMLGLRDGERFVAFIHVGTPTVPPQDRPRPALADIVSEWTA